MSNISITFTGDSLLAAAEQALAFAMAVAGPGRLPPAIPPVERPASTAHAIQPKPKAGLKSISPGPEPQPEPGLPEVKAEAIKLLRGLYKAGHQAAVRAISKSFGVEKLNDVPIAKASELMAKAVELELETTANAADD